MDIKEQMRSIKDSIPVFLAQQQSGMKDGYYKYSFSSDIYKKGIIGASSYAAKIAYTIEMPQESEMVKNILAALQEAQNERGYIYDNKILALSIRNNAVRQLKEFKCPSLRNEEYKRAESRQCISALMMYGKIPLYLPVKEVIDNNEMASYLEKFNWRMPWAAGSHFSHMMFFQKVALAKQYISKEQYDVNISSALEWISRLQNKETGSWHLGEVTSQQAINGAMKVLTGFNAVNINPVTTDMGRKLVDLCLDNINNEQACDNFNIIYVMKYASQKCRGYRQDEIIDFAEKRFRIYLDYYFPREGGFSFYKNRSNDMYYGCKVALGKNEPDIHGTALFMWGIAIIASLLGIDKDLGLREFST